MARSDGRLPPPGTATATVAATSPLASATPITPTSTPPTSVRSAFGPRRRRGAAAVSPAVARTRFGPVLRLGIRPRRLCPPTLEAGLAAGLVSRCRTRHLARFRLRPAALFSRPLDRAPGRAVVRSGHRPRIHWRVAAGPAAVRR
ncbi:MAG: hypothetical protein M3Q93_12365, partial [Gemmatimonadota bacterium]|nr:hypothetical protein [Gemmatimonadota bacterium]